MFEKSMTERRQKEGRNLDPANSASPMCTKEAYLRNRLKFWNDNTYYSVRLFKKEQGIKNGQH